MISTILRPAIFTALFLAHSISHATTIDILEISGYLNSPDIGVSSIQDVQISQYGPSTDDQFGNNGLNLSFVNNLDTNNLGSFSWVIENTGSTLTNVNFFGFLDTEIDFVSNGYFNEYGDGTGFIAGSGSSDSKADYWEIDEPGLLFGDIIDNLFLGSLDNFNNVPQGLNEDVSLALGFNIGTLQTNDILSINFQISDTNNGGLLHFDPDSNAGYYFNGTATVDQIPVSTVPAPGTFFLFLSGITVLFMSAKNKNTQKQ